MSIQANQRELQKQVELLAPVTKGRSPLPILSNMAMAFSEDASEMFASNLEIYIKTKVSPEQILSPFKTTVNSEKIAEILRNLRPDAPILIEQQEKQRMVVKQGASSFIINTLPYEDFPVFPQTPDGSIKLNIKAQDMIAALESVIFSASDSDSRFNLNSIYIEPLPNALKLVTTDGHRLSVHSTACSLDITDPAQGVMLPKSSANHLLKLISRLKDEDIEIQLHAKAITLETTEYFVSMRLLDGEYPDYNKVVPKGEPRYFVSDKAELTAVVKRVGLMTSDRNKGMTLAKESDKLVVSCVNPELGEATDQIAIHVSNFDEFKLILNKDYLLEALNSLKSKEVCVLIAEKEGAPVTLKSELNSADFTIIMPMRA
jgi:DNA polymerase-3 subunit beta